MNQHIKMVWPLRPQTWPSNFRSSFFTVSWYSSNRKNNMQYYQFATLQHSDMFFFTFFVKMYSFKVRTSRIVLQCLAEWAVYSIYVSFCRCYMFRMRRMVESCYQRLLLPSAPAIFLLFFFFFALSVQKKPCSDASECRVWQATTLRPCVVAPTLLQTLSRLLHLRHQLHSRLCSKFAESSERERNDSQETPREPQQSTTAHKRTPVNPGDPHISEVSKQCEIPFEMSLWQIDLRRTS